VEHQTLSMLRGTVGLWAFAHETVAASESGEVAAFAESLGFGGYWIPEASGREALVNASLLLSATSTIVVGTAIASIWARDAMAAMNGARTLAAVSNDRFVLGLGVSHKPLVQGMRGHLYDKPRQAMERYLDAMETAPMSSPEGGGHPPILLAALGPAMLRLSATKASGAIPYLVTPEHTSFARELMGPDAFLVVEQAVALTEDQGDFRDRAANHLQRYTNLPNYFRNWKRLGFSDEDFVAGGSHRLQDALVAHGDESAIWTRVDEHFAAGADHVCIQILGKDPLSMPRDDWTRLSPGAIGR